MVEVEAIVEIRPKRIYPRPTEEERSQTQDLVFPDEANLLNRAFEVTERNNPRLRYATLQQVASRAYDARRRQSKLEPFAWEGLVANYLAEDLESISNKLRWTASLDHWREGQPRIQNFFRYTQDCSLFTGLDMETLIQILYREPDGLAVIGERVGEQIPKNGGEVHLILIPENGSDVTPSSDTKLKPYEVFVAASMLWDLDRQSELNFRFHGKLVRRLYPLGISNRLQSAVQATQSSKGELLKDPTLCHNLYAKLLAIANHDINAPVLNRDSRAASVIVDVIWGVIDNGTISIEEFRRFFSSGFTIVQKPPRRS